MDLEYNFVYRSAILFVRSSRRNCSILDPTADTKKKRKERKEKHDSHLKSLSTYPVIRPVQR